MKHIPSRSNSLSFHLTSTREIALCSMLSYDKRYQDWWVCNWILLMLKVNKSFSITHEVPLYPSFPVALFSTPPLRNNKHFSSTSILLPKKEDPGTSVISFRQPMITRQIYFCDKLCVTDRYDIFFIGWAPQARNTSLNFESSILQDGVYFNHQRNRHRSTDKMIHLLHSN